MPRVHAKRKSLLIDDKRVYVRSGEISYYRTPRDSWQDRLKAAKDCYLNCVSTYVPWFWHETEEGKFDFTGETHPQRDLLSFLKAVKDSGLYLFVRPGPFINSEFRYGGHPEWLFRRYPEIMSRTADGRLAVWIGHGEPVPSQLHPKFLELVEKWYEEVIPILADFSIEKGGPIVLSQPDNEMNLVYTFSLTESLYDPHILGSQSKPGLWHKWLLEQYGDLQAIRERYCEGFPSVQAVEAPREVRDDPVGRRKILDWLHFKEWHIYTYAEHLVSIFHKFGLRVPFSMNEPNCFLFKGGDHAAASRYFRKYSGQYFTTGHLYLGGGEQDILGVPMTLYRIELVKLFDLEGPTLEGEIGLGWCDLTRNRAHYNFDLLTRLALGHGMDGYNIYMFSGGYNPPGSNSYGQDYNWNAPLQPDGSRHPVFELASRLGKWITGWEKEVVDTEKVFDFYLGISTDVAFQAKWVERARVGSGESKDADIYGHATVMTTPAQDAVDSHLELIRIMTALQFNFRLVNFSYLPGDGLLPKPLVVPSGERLPPAAFDLILKHLDRGLPVVFYPTVPRMDTDGNLRNDLISLLGLEDMIEKSIEIPGMEAFRTRFLAVQTDSIPEVAVDRGLRTFEKIGKAEILVRHAGAPVAFKKLLKKTPVVVMGMYPSYLTRDSQSTFRMLFADSIGLMPYARSEDGLLHIVVRRLKNSQSMILTAANVLGAESSTEIHLDLDGKESTFPVATKLEIAPKSIFNYWLNLDLGYAKLMHSTVELYPENEERTVFTTRGDRLADGELAFDRQVELTVDEALVSPVVKNGLYVYVMTHGRRASTVRINASRAQ